VDNSLAPLKYPTDAQVRRISWLSWGSAGRNGPRGLLENRSRPATSFDCLTFQLSGQC